MFWHVLEFVETIAVSAVVALTTENLVTSNHDSMVHHVLKDKSDVLALMSWYHTITAE